MGRNEKQVQGLSAALRLSGRCPLSGSGAMILLQGNLPWPPPSLCLVSWLHDLFRERQMTQFEPRRRSEDAAESSLAI